MSPIAQAAVRGALALFIVAAGAGVMGALVATRAPAEGKPASDKGVVVRTMKVKSSRQQATVAAQGTVIPAHEVTLQPEVQGRVVFRSDNLVPGGRFEKGEVLLRIDASEYALRAKQSSAQIEQAEQQLRIEESRGELAQEEWRLIGEDEGASDVGRSVALRKPHRKEAEARMELAEHERGLAVLNVGRTTLRAPFNGFVREGHVNVGQYISPAMSLGKLVGSDEFWVQTSVPIENLSTIRVPGFNVDEGEGSDVSVWQEAGEGRIERSGKVTRLYGDVDPAGRMARILVQIDDPLGLESKDGEGTLPLLLGAYVHVDIEGESMVDVVEVPRSAVHQGRFVYVYGKDDRLSVRQVTVAWRKPTTLLISKGLADGDEIITSRLSNAVEGLELRRVDEGATGASASGTPPEKPVERKGKTLGRAEKTDEEKHAQGSSADTVEAKP